jgi:tetratricopeptide (TPR) repeat protein
MALFNIGNALANAGRYAEAIAKYKEFLEAEPGNDEAYCTSANVI